MEEWRPLPSAPHYAISSYGHVWRWLKTGRLKPVVRRLTDRGRWEITVSWQGKGTVRLVANCVAEAFIGPRLEGHQTNHINGNRTDDRSENLEYITSAQNITHAKANDLFSRKSPHEKNCFTCVNDVWLARWLSIGGVSYRKIGKLLGLPYDTISRAVRGFTYANLGREHDASIERSARMKTEYALGIRRPTRTGKLTAEQREYAMNEVNSGRSRSAVAKELGVSHTCINFLIRGKSWR